MSGWQYISLQVGADHVYPWGHVCFANLLSHSLTGEQRPKRERKACDERPEAPAPGLRALIGLALPDAPIIVWLLPCHPLSHLLQLRGRPEQHATFCSLMVCRLLVMDSSPLESQGRALALDMQCSALMHCYTMSEV